MTGQEAGRRAAAAATAQRILERLDEKDPLALALRGALEDRDGTRLVRLDAQVERQDERFFVRLEPLMRVDPPLKDLYYGINTPEGIADAEHDMELLLWGHRSLEVLAHAAALPPCGLENQKEVVQQTTREHGRAGRRAGSGGPAGSDRVYPAGFGIQHRKDYQ